MNISSGRAAVIDASSNRTDPAAAFRGLTKGASSFSTRSLLMSSMQSRGINTSPRTSISVGVESIEATLNGIERIVRRLAVTFSPCSPSPRVAPRVNCPSSYTSETPKPSIFNSATYSISSSGSICRTRLSKSVNSSGLKVLSKLNILL